MKPRNVMRIAIVESRKAGTTVTVQFRSVSRTRRAHRYMRTIAEEHGRSDYYGTDWAIEIIAPHMEH